MEILAPQYIWLLTVIPFVAVGAYIALLRRIKRLNLVSQNKRSVLSEWKRIVVPTLVSALLILSFLRPYRGYEDISQNGNGRDNLILIDVSRSMLTRDASPTRLEIAKRKVLDLISIIRENHTLDRIGIILFAGRAYLYCPPTQDLGAVKEFTAHISTELITAQGSGINEALITAASVIKRTNMLQPRLFIFSDGEDLGFKATEAATILKSSELRPLIIGIGTEAGSPIDLGREGFVKDNSGKIVISKLARDVLQNLAEAADGSYASFSVGTQDLRKLLGDHSLQDLNQQSVSNKANVRIYNEYGHIFLWLALALVSLSLIFRKTLPLFLFLSCFLLNSTSAIAQSETPSLRESWKLYNEGKFAEAASGFAQGYSLNPDSLDIAQALGSSLYKQGKFKEATKYFSQIASTA